MIIVTNLKQFVDWIQRRANGSVDRRSNQGGKSLALFSGLEWGAAPTVIKRDCTISRNLSVYANPILHNIALLSSKLLNESRGKSYPSFPVSFHLCISGGPLMLARQSISNMNWAITGKVSTKFEEKYPKMPPGEIDQS